MKTMNKDLYYLIDFPDCQEYMEHPDYTDQVSACVNDVCPTGVFIPKYIVDEINQNR